ncbi:hypothetical protein QZH56_00840 [Streptomyces olivoreticuli]|uniref:hypothetical protein n=1 Tax=Streptomyces olivoreticuli TaxID=68246 RepID=UPI002659C6D5|nr:hypothetical protein [Streptomyces olivoreticuli]WKK24257.1 hypothetical protein QZH56_00840 [Streptomyces olivoreticuli]
MISLLFFTRSSVAERDYSGRAGRNLAVRGETRGHKLRGKWPPTGSLRRPPSHVGGNIDFHIFDILFEIRQGTRKPEDLTIVLADVKYDSSTLTREQRAVLRAMNEGRTRGEHWKARENNGGPVYQPWTDAVFPQPEKLAMDIRRSPVGSLERTSDIAETAPDNKMLD